MAERWVYGILAKQRKDPSCIFRMPRLSGIAQSTMQERVKASSKFITRQTVLLDFPKLSLVQYFFIIRPFAHKRRTAHEFMSGCGSVNSLFIMSGSDMLGEAVFPDCVTAERFFDRLESGMQLGSVERFLIQQEIMREGFMPGGGLRWEQ